MEFWPVFTSPVKHDMDRHFMSSITAAVVVASISDTWRPLGGAAKFFLLKIVHEEAAR